MAMARLRAAGDGLRGAGGFFETFFFSLAFPFVFVFAFAPFAVTRFDGVRDLALVFPFVAMSGCDASLLFP
jgi:hypothetical protein